MFYKIVAVHEKVVDGRLVIDKPGVEDGDHKEISRKHGNAVADVFYFRSRKDA